MEDAIASIGTMLIRQPGVSQNDRMFVTPTYLFSPHLSYFFISGFTFFKVSFQALALIRFPFESFRLYTPGFV